MVQGIIETLLPIDTITRLMQDRFLADAPLDDMRARIEQAFATNPAQWWQHAVGREVQARLSDQWDAMQDAVRHALIDAIQDGALDEA